MNDREAFDRAFVDHDLPLLRQSLREQRQKRSDLLTFGVLVIALAVFLAAIGAADLLVGAVLASWLVVAVWQMVKRGE